MTYTTLLGESIDSRIAKRVLRSLDRLADIDTDIGILRDNPVGRRLTLLEGEKGEIMEGIKDVLRQHPVPTTVVLSSRDGSFVAYHQSTRRVLDEGFFGRPIARTIVREHPEVVTAMNIPLAERYYGSLAGYYSWRYVPVVTTGESYRGQREIIDAWTADNAVHAPTDIGGEEIYE